MQFSGFWFGFSLVDSKEAVSVLGDGDCSWRMYVSGYLYGCPGIRSRIAVSFLGGRYGVLFVVGFSEPESEP